MSVLAAGATLLLCACTVPPAGVSGIGVDASGGPVGYLMVCHDHVNAAELAHGKDPWDGSWESGGWITGFASIDLAEPGPEWRVTQPLEALTTQQTYTFYGSTTDSSWSTGSVDFTLADLAELQPGSVRYWTGRSPTGYSVVTAAEFQAHACDNG